MFNYKNKQANIRQSNAYMFAKTLSMFEWQGLPETIPHRELERLLQRHGFAFITEHEGKLYAFHGTLGGEQDAYGNPKDITINNVGLNFNKTLSIKDDGVLILSDDSKMGLLPLFNKYHYMMAENDISMVIRGFNSRIQKLISASDDKTKASADAYLTKVIDGELGVIGESALFDGIRLQSSQSGQGDGITPLIEFQQYMRGTLYNEIGLNANFNMKRERLTGGEMEANDDALYPFVDNMMQCRLIATTAINEKYGTEIVVEYGSVWHKKNKELVDGIVDEDSDTSATDETTDESTEQHDSDGETGVEDNEPLDGANDDDLETSENEEGEIENEQQLENDSSGVDSVDSENSSPEKTIAEIEAILDDEDLSDEERKSWETMLEELRGNENEVE